MTERVLGHVISSGIKVLALAVIVGIGTGIFSQFTTPSGGDPTIDQALAIMLASLALFGLGIFGPGLATGLVSGIRSSVLVRLRRRYWPAAVCSRRPELPLWGVRVCWAAPALPSSGCRFPPPRVRRTVAANADVTIGSAPPNARATSGSTEAPEWARRLQRGHRVRTAFQWPHMRFVRPITAAAARILL